MREKRKWVFAGIIGITILTGISALKEFTKIGDVYQAKFAFIAPKKWGKIARGVRKADEDLNTNTKCILYTQDTENSQADALQYALLSGVDGIITGGMEKSEKTENIIREAKKKGVPVVFVDSDLTESARNCYIGSDNYQVGYMAGEALNDAAPNEKRICMIVSYENNSNQQERIKGFLDAADNAVELQVEAIVEGKSSALILGNKLPEILRKYPDINVIVCAEGVSSHYCWKILEGNGFSLDKYCIIGMDYYEDLAPFIKNGVYSAVIWQDQYRMGYEAVKYLKDLYDGKERTENVIYTDLKLLSQNSMEVAENEIQEEIEWYVF